MRIQVRYPLGAGAAADLVLRSDADWEADVEPLRRSRDRTRFDFDLGDERPYRYFKPLLRDGADLRWARGENALALRDRKGPTLVHPHFAEDSSCHVCDLHRVPSSFEEGGREVRVFLPPGYDENTLARYPVLYMQDGQNLFFADESFGGKHWRVAETLGVLDSMNLVRQVIVVGVYPGDRMRDYTAPGYEAYGRFLAEELKPWVDEHYRTLAGAANTAVIGSSLGGVVSLHVGWRWPGVFGQVGCMSSTFGYADDLFERVAGEKRPPLRVYLDSGWPRDNYEVTRSLAALLAARGWREGRDLLYVAFPDGRHDEESWARRVHVPFQFFFRQ